MGRHHGLKLPQHLYLSSPAPPPPPPPTFTLSSASSFLSTTSASVAFYSPAAIIHETTRSTTAAVGELIPGFKTSAAFLATLRANLTLDDSLPTTPDLRPIRMSTPSRSTAAAAASSATGDVPDAILADLVPESDPLSSIPALTTLPATSTDDKVEALHLLADSVAQQRQAAASAIIYHPYTLGAVGLTLALALQTLRAAVARADAVLLGTTAIGILMAVLVTIRWYTRPYLDHAERVGTWAWLEGPSSDSSSSSTPPPTVLLTRFGDEAIGAVVVQPTSGAAGSPTTRKSRRDIRGVIRGWTVKRRYRGKGVGEGLLEEAVALCADKGWAGPEFADEHAHSARFVPAVFQTGFDRNEARARTVLERVKREAGIGITTTASAGGRKGKR